MDTSGQWPKVMESNETYQRPMLEERRARQDQKGGDIALNCPRCNSANTKFCYYNNYSLTQPRYYCKTCKRYWTQGGTLRNVPVGGGTRKNKRSSSSKKQLDSTPQSSSSPNPIIIEPQNPNSFSFSRGLTSFISMPIQDTNTTYPSGFGLEGLQGVQGSGINSTSRLLFPFQDLRQASNTSHEFGEHRAQQADPAIGYWSGMIGDASWPN
ncbi:hypothetical protein GIB67_033353 [Kingdonia uniflora]|uniref:Dof zinc finger protein n=1 Tax=Kingdonia uniflora TaxID=39325 RepID=A0A7J7LTY0_9MAGN|nr:hypothetical protein GIB67_033353 [Kingdonia uniflora]